MLLHRNDILFRQGETGPLYRMESGLLKIVRVQEDGKQLLLNFIVPGEMIPHHSLISPKAYHGTAIALTTCQVEPVAAAEWYARLAVDAPAALEVARLLQSKLRMMQERIDQLAMSSPAEKLDAFRSWIAAYLPPDTAITDLLTQEEIGQFLAIRRETVNRLLRGGQG
ncbi:putative transcriptional regulator, Crp/Fnr family [Paenibacillus curdlanolyticus YK9]|uniref:Putative transcriptional regulator, Crp/Fnr family n=1 Tax=Paenibacillus curdlanolyticus YK9 TaxID=717606 RepID=E0IEV6_9BACL|nr:Crp/Fnr family transcriptional regulator [Paenibacillus curdlanolyticus]EFM09194.1 putative transcriptional regulator, Crp/Fnr family [Paenibacillus curdlanolyticus YK9]